MVNEVSYDTDSSSYLVVNVVSCVNNYPVDIEVSYYTDSKSHAVVSEVCSASNNNSRSGESLKVGRIKALP